MDVMGVYVWSISGFYGYGDSVGIPIGFSVGMTGMAIALQAYGVFVFLFHYAIPVMLFAFCYGRIFHTIRRQSKVVAGHAGRSQDIPMATTSRDPDAGQVQQQATGTTTGAKLSHTEMNVLKTMITVIVCFIACWSAGDVAAFLHRMGVSSCVVMLNKF